MTDRRLFLKTSVAAASVLALSRSGMARAAGGTPMQGIVYRRESPGQWEKKVGSHAPVVTVAKGKVTIETKHGMSAAHFIVRHTLVLEDGTVVGGTTFTAQDTPVSHYTLPAGYAGILYATSFCNRHDFWLTEIKV